MHISVHVSLMLQYIINLSFFGQIKAFIFQNVSYFSQTITKLMLLTQWLWTLIKRLANNWVIDSVVLWQWLCNLILHMKVM